MAPETILLQNSIAYLEDCSLKQACEDRKATTVLYFLFFYPKINSRLTIEQRKEDGDNTVG